MAEQVSFFDGKKFMWDGQSEKGFEVKSCNEDGKVLLYTRRVVTETETDQN